MSDARDITERLRSRAWEDRHHRRYREEAAAEIERLRACLQSFVNTCTNSECEWCEAARAAMNPNR